MVSRHIGALEHRGQFELTGSHLLVTGLGRDAELEELAFAVEHVAQDSIRDGAKVMVVELLPLRWFGAEQRAAGVEQIRAAEEEAAVDQEVLLLGTGERDHRVRVLVTEEP